MDIDVTIGFVTRTFHTCEKGETIMGTGTAGKRRVSMRVHFHNEDKPLWIENVTECERNCTLGKLEIRGTLFTSATPSYFTIQLNKVLYTERWEWLEVTEEFRCKEES